jgi:excisionase family DNA binding protein
MCACDHQPDLMTLTEAAEDLRVDYETLRRWIAKGVFTRVVRVGPTKLIRLHRVDVRAQRVEAGA